MHDMQEEGIEFEEDPYRQQLERTIEILEEEVKLKVAINQELKEAAVENQLLTQSCIEQRNVIQDLKSQLKVLLSINTRDQCVATNETNESIQKAIDILKPFKEKFQDLYPVLSKLVVQDAVPREEVEYDENTVGSILKEVYGTENEREVKMTDDSGSIQLSTSQDAIEQSPLLHKATSADQKKTPIMQATNTNKGSAWDIFKKLAGVTDEKEKTSSSQPEILNKGSKSKEWENIFTLLRKGESVFSVKSKMDNLFKAKSHIPQKYRGMIWSRLIGNRSRVTPRIYNMLLLQLPQANPHTKECILRDVERTFYQFSKSEKFQQIKIQTIKILQLFEVKSLQ